MNLAEYHLDKDDNGYPLVCYTRSKSQSESLPSFIDSSAYPTTEFVCYVDAGMTMHDLMLKIQQFDHNSDKSRSEGDSQ